jgi:hypothetical protein
LHFKGAFIDPSVNHANKDRPALVEERRRSKIRVSRINGWTTWRQCMCKRWSAVVLQGAKQRIGVDLITRAGEEASATIVAEVVAE